MKSKTKRNRGRPVQNKMPETINRDPEHVAKVLMQTPVKSGHRWEYEEKDTDVK